MFSLAICAALLAAASLLPSTANLFSAPASQAQSNCDSQLAALEAAKEAYAADRVNQTKKVSFDAALAAWNLCRGAQSAASKAAAKSAPNATGGPDTFGHTWRDNQGANPIPYQFIDISGTGTVLGSGDDEGYPYTLQAPFSFYGQAVTTVAATTNGYISTDQTDDGPDLSNDCPLPSVPSTGGGARIYPLHDDLILNGNNSIKVQYFATCPRPNDYGGCAEACTVFMWDNVEHFGGNGATWDMEAILYHTRNEIVYQIGPGNPETGGGSTTGIQNAAATIGLNVSSCNTAGSIPNGYAVAIFAPNQPSCCTITCPANQVAWTSGTSATVTYPAPTADAGCGTVTCSPASGSSFAVGTTTVTCSTTAGPSCSFNVTVNRLNLGITSTEPLSCIGPGNKVQYSFSATNTTGAAANVSVSAALSNFVYLPNTASADQTGSVIVLANVISWTGSLGAGQTVRVSWMGQIADNATPGTQACFTVTATANNLPVAGQDQSCLTVNCPTVGPGGIFPTSSEASDQKAGSVLVYNVYTSSTDPTKQNTRINITNVHSTRPAFVHLFFVAEGCAVADSYICLTASQTASFLASDLDPGTTGYLVAVAVDGVRGCPTSFNYLIGDEYVKFNTGHAANLGAIAFSQLAGGIEMCDQNSVIATLRFDGVSYNRTPRTVALDNIGSRADGNDTLLILNRIGGNLGIGAASLGTLFGIFYDDAENALSYSVTGGCQLRSAISNNFPRITPRFETFIPAGRTGWT
ncbi:MAG: hypothetical protein JNK38_08285, partial [Acidobacteria bacterium]|nr:hypothetical protein [Acidobacteriota bacterium]